MPRRNTFFYYSRTDSYDRTLPLNSSHHRTPQALSLHLRNRHRSRSGLHPNRSLLPCQAAIWMSIRKDMESVRFRSVLRRMPHATP